MISFNPKFSIKQRVFHILPDSPQGIIIDISYKHFSQEIWYLVALGFNNEVWARECELSITKTF